MGQQIFIEITQFLMRLPWRLGLIYVENIGFEPTTSCLPGKRSSQMS